MATKIEGNAALAQLTAAAETLSRQSAAGSVRSADEGAAGASLFSSPVSVELSQPNFLSDEYRVGLFFFGLLAMFLNIALAAQAMANYQTNYAATLKIFEALTNEELAALGEKSAEILNNPHLHTPLWIFSLLAGASLLVCVIAVIGYGKVSINKSSTPAAAEEEPETAAEVKDVKVEPTSLTIADQMEFTITGSGLHKNLACSLKKDAFELSEITVALSGDAKSLKCSFNKTAEIVAGEWTLSIYDPQGNNPKDPITTKLTLQ